MAGGAQVTVTCALPAVPTGVPGGSVKRTSVAFEGMPSTTMRARYNAAGRVPKGGDVKVVPVWLAAGHHMSALLSARCNCSIGVLAPRRP